VYSNVSCSSTTEYPSLYRTNRFIVCCSKGFIELISKASHSVEVIAKPFLLLSIFLGHVFSPSYQIAVKVDVSI
jgi:hypothetical protein